MEKTMLQQIRCSKGETVTSMAKQLGIGVSRYYMIETGDRPATAKLAVQIAEALNVEVKDIFLPQSFTVRDSNDKESA